MSTRLYQHSLDCDTSCMEVDHDNRIKRPTANQVCHAIIDWLEYAKKPTAAIPTQNRYEWGLDHGDFFIGRVFPVLQIPMDIRRIVTEAYLAGYEVHSDGSSVVPESRRWGRYVKDWEGVMHDYIRWLHSRNLPDAFGTVWTYLEWNDAYRRAWDADGMSVRGCVWYAGLMAGGWWVWNR